MVWQTASILRWLVMVSAALLITACDRATQSEQPEGQQHSRSPGTEDGVAKRTATVEEEYFGAFDSQVQVEWLPDGRRMKLLRDLTFTDANGLEWKATRDRIINGASIPKIFWSAG